MHRIEFDPNDRLIVATCTGFWSEEDQRAFGRALTAAIHDHGRDGRFDLLFDVTAQPPQSAAVVEAQQALSARIVTSTIRRMAIVVTSRLLANQLHRVRRGTATEASSPSTEIAYFTDRHAADRWLATPATPAE